MTPTASPGRAAPDHEIRLDLGARMTQHGTGPKDDAHSLRLDIWTENSMQPRGNELMVGSRRRRHEELPANELVLVSVVGKAVHLLERPSLELLRHVHGPTVLDHGNRAGMRRGHVPLGCNHHRNVAVGVDSTIDESVCSAMGGSQGSRGAPNRHRGFGDVRWECDVAMWE